jgi:predicted lipoprotein with Yx(FWY)xxD motif
MASAYRVEISYQTLAGSRGERAGGARDGKRAEASRMCHVSNRVWYHVLQEDMAMVLSRRALFLVAGIVLALAFAGCGSPTAVASSPPPVRPTAPFITTASVALNGKSQTILTTATSLTLYYYTADTATTVACAGPCIATWRPLMFAGPGAPIAPPALSGTLTLLPAGTGNQIEYNGHPLYTYVKDATPGQTGGQGLLGKWFIATPGLPRNS